MALTDEARKAIADKAWGVAEKMKPSAAALDTNRAYPEDHLDALAGSVAFHSPRSEPNGENQGGSVIISQITGRDSYELIE